MESSFGANTNRRNGVMGIHNLKKRGRLLAPQTSSIIKYKGAFITPTPTML